MTRSCLSRASPIQGRARRRAPSRQRLGIAIELVVGDRIVDGSLCHVLLPVIMASLAPAIGDVTILHEFLRP